MHELPDDGDDVAQLLDRVAEREQIIVARMIRSI
jgi:hypothetical protein